jgi:hypothetical protein
MARFAPGLEAVEVALEIRRRVLVAASPLALGVSLDRAAG